MTERRTRWWPQMILPLGWKDELVKQMLAPEPEVRASIEETGER